MRTVAVYRGMRQAALFLIFVFAAPCPEGLAANRALDLAVLEEAGRSCIALLLEEAPRYRLEKRDGNAFILTLEDTQGSPQLKRRLEAGEAGISMDKGGDGSGLSLRIALPGSPKETEVSWEPESSLLLLRVGPFDKTDPSKVSESGPLAVRRIRFGIHETYSRLVLDLEREPRWELRFQGKGRASLRIPQGEASMKKSSFNGLERFQDVRVGGDEGGVNVTVGYGDKENHFRLFWHHIGKKLVMDLCDGPVNAPRDILEKAMAKAPTPEEAAPVSAPSPSPATPPAAAVPVLESAAKGPEAGGRIPGVGGENPGSPVPGFEGPVVRRKIVRPAAARGKIPPSPELMEALKVRIETDFGPPPGTLLEESWVDHLSPDQAYLVGRIQESWESRNYRKGVGLLEDFLERFPDSPVIEPLSFLIGDFQMAILQGGGKKILPELIASYTRAINRFRDSGRVPMACVQMGRAYAVMGEGHEALKPLNTAIGRYPLGGHLALAYLVRGRVYLGLNQAEKALDDLKTVTMRFPESPQAEGAEYEIAKYFFSVGVYEESWERLGRLLENRPEFHLKHPESLSLMAKNAFYLKQYDVAREYYFRALNLGRQPESNDLLLSHIGDTYHHQSKRHEAEKFYKLAIEEAPESQGAGIARLRLADYETGVKGFEAIHQKNSSTAIGDLALLNIATRYYETNQYAMAMKSLQAVMNKPGQKDILEKAQRLYCKAVEGRVGELYRRGEYEKIVLMKESGDFPHPENMDPEAYLQVVRSYARLGRYREAVTGFISIKPYDLSLSARGPYFLQMAESYLGIGDAKGAETTLARGLKGDLDPADKQRLMIRYAEILRERGEFERALEFYAAVVEAGEGLPEEDIAAVRLDMGRILNRQGQYEEARASLERCIALTGKAPTDQERLKSAYIELGTGYYREGDDGNALASFQKGLDAGYGPEDEGYWEATYHMALCLLNLGDVGEAERLFRRVSEEGDPLLQQKVQIKLGMLELEKELDRLPIAR